MAQAPKKIIVENSDFADVNQVEVPDALLLMGNVRVNHDGVVMTCNKAYYFQKENYIKAFGNVQMVQGDTLFLNSKYAEYNGNVKKAYAFFFFFLYSAYLLFKNNVSPCTICTLPKALM